MALILAVDDEVEVLNSVREILEEEGHQVETESSPVRALERVNHEHFDLIVLDVIMPDLTGIEVCQRIRANPFLNRIPILFLTAKGRGNDIVEGLDAGGDDYLTKPFQIIELPAWVRALLRRSPGGILDTMSDTLQVGELVLSLERLEVAISDTVIMLTAVEHRLLHYLMERPSQPTSIDQLLQSVWEYPMGVGDPSLVYKHIANLRGKIEADPEHPRFVANVPRKGYMLTA